MQTDGAKFGERAHKIRENWLRDGTWPAEHSDERECVAAGLSHWLPPGQVNAVELELHPRIHGVVWWMKIDDLSHYTPGSYICVGDLKTTKDFAWAKTETDLLTDPQRIVYTAWAADTFDVAFVGAQWTYCRTKKPASRSVLVVEPRETVRARLVVLTETVVRPMIAANAWPLEAFPRDGMSNILDTPRGKQRACEAFGGCQFKAECLAEVPAIDLVSSQLFG